MIDWELVEWGKEDYKSIEEKDPHWIVMLLGVTPIYIAFVAFVVWCVKKIINL